MKTNGANCYQSAQTPIVIHVVWYQLYVWRSCYKRTFMFLEECL